MLQAAEANEKPGQEAQCHSDKDDGKSTGTEISSGLFFC